MILKPILDFDYDPPELEEIKKCLYVLLGTRKGTMPLNRDMGLDLEQYIDEPIDIAKNRYAADVIEQIDRYEPRVTVTAVVFEEPDTQNGQLRPHIYLSEGSG